MDLLKDTQGNLCQFIEATEHELYLCLPSISEEIKHSILKLKEIKENILVICQLILIPRRLVKGYGRFRQFSKTFR